MTVKQPLMFVRLTMQWLTAKPKLSSPLLLLLVSSWDCWSVKGILVEMENSHR